MKANLKELERSYWLAKASFDQAEKTLKDIKSELLSTMGINTGNLTEEQAACYEKATIETANTKVSHFAKSKESWDSKLLLALMDQFPAIKDAQRFVYWSEARISKK